jgi:hypothetical protein
MTAKSTKGINVYLSDGTDPTKLVPTAITKAAPAVVTVADVSALTVGDPATVVKTGFSEIDGKTYVVGNIDDTANTFELIGSDTSASTGSLASSPEIDVYLAADSVKLCLSELTFNPETPGTIAVGTFCDPSATLPATATGAGTATLSGFVDVSDPGYTALLDAEEDGKTRMLSMVLPQDQGYIVAPITISAVTWATPLEGGIGFTATGALGSKPVHRYIPAP